MRTRERILIATFPRVPNGWRVYRETAGLSLPSAFTPPQLFPPGLILRADRICFRVLGIDDLCVTLHRCSAVAPSLTSGSLTVTERLWNDGGGPADEDKEVTLRQGGNRSGRPRRPLDVPAQESGKDVHRGRQVRGLQSGLVKRFSVHRKPRVSVQPAQFHERPETDRTASIPARLGPTPTDRTHW